MTESEIETELKKWGNSLGIRVPLSAVRASRIGPGDRVRVRIEKAFGPNPEFWGRGKRHPPRVKVDFLKWKEAEKRREKRREATAFRRNRSAR